MGKPLAFDKRVVYLALAVGTAALLLLSLPSALRPAVAQGPLNVSKTASPGAVNVGDLLTYTIVVSNTGGDVTGLQLDDPLPADVGAVSCTVVGTGPCPVSGITIWTGDLAANQSVTIIYVVRVNSYPAGGVLRNTATLNPGPLTDSVDTPVFRVEVTKEPIVSTAAPGELVTYTILVRNTSPVTGTVTVNEAPPAGLIFHYCQVIRYTGAVEGCSYFPPTSTVVWSGVMFPGELLTVIFVMRMPMNASMIGPMFNWVYVNGTPVATSETRLNPPTRVTDTPTPTSRPRRTPQPTETPTVTPIPTPFELPKTGGAAPAGGIIIGLLVVVAWTLGGLLVCSWRAKRRL